MDIIIKQRILGSLVLIAIAIVFVPALMSGNTSLFHESLKSNIPEKPAFVIDLSEEQKLRVANDNQKMAARMMAGELASAATAGTSFPLSESLPETNALAKSTVSASDKVKNEDIAAVKTKAAVVQIAASPKSDPKVSHVKAEPDIKQKRHPSAGIIVSKPIENSSMRLPGKTDANAAKKKTVTTLPPGTNKAVKLAKAKIKKGWVVQVASFREPANATAMQKRLARHGMQSRVVKNSSKKGMLYRVRLGPWEKKQLAAKQQAALEKIVGLDTMLLRLR